MQTSASSPEAENIWTAAVQALVQFTVDVPSVEHARAAGKVSPETYAGWIKSVDGIKTQIAALIQASPTLKSAIDAAGASVGFSGMNRRGTVLEAYLGDLEAVSDTALELLRKSFLTAAGLQGLEGPLRPLEMAVAEAGWVKLLQLFTTSPVIKSGVVAAILGGAAVSGVGVALNGETQAYLDYNAKLCAQTGKCAPLTPPGSGLGVVVLGLVAVAGFALYMKNRASSPGGS
jgi:hypothetical protein